jgi:hypothetical protein
MAVSALSQPESHEIVRANLMGEAQGHVRNFATDGALKVVLTNEASR